MSPPIYDVCGEEASKDAVSDYKLLPEVFQHAFQGARDIPVVLR